MWIYKSISLNLNDPNFLSGRHIPWRGFSAWWQPWLHFPRVKKVGRKMFTDFGPTLYIVFCKLRKGG